MATTRFADHLLDGDHASRPAAGDVPAGTLYACSDHGLIYQSDGVSSWATWATLGATSMAAEDVTYDNGSSGLTADDVQEAIDELTGLSAGGSTDGWTATADTWTYASATTFTIAGVDRTAQLSRGTRIKLTQTTDKYFVVVASTFSTNTTVTLTGGSDYSLANAAITSPYYSYEVNPQGYPGWFNYAAQLDQGASTNIAKTTNAAKFAVVGPTCFLHVNLSPTGSGSAGSAVSVSMPVEVHSAFSISMLGSGMYNDGGVLYRCIVAAGSSTTMHFFASSITSNAYLGSDPNMAIANGDNLAFTAAYQIA